MKYINILLLSLISFISTQCTNDISKPELINQPKKKVIYLSPANTSGIQSFDDFDWENTSSMNIYIAGQKYVVGTPFNSGTFSGLIDDDTRLDIKKVDGWRLVFNYFPTDGSNVIHPILLLYNQYRGIFKLFYYHINPSITSAEGNIMAMLVTHDGTNAISTSLFNNSIYCNPLDKNSGNIVSQSTIGGLPNQAKGLIQHQWYAFEWEASNYDPLFLGSNKRLLFTSWGVDLSTLKLSGDIVGNISGTLSQTVATTSTNGIISDADLKNSIGIKAKSLIMKNTGDKLITFLNGLKTSTSNSALKNIIGLINPTTAVPALASLAIGPLASYISLPISKLLGYVFPGKTSQSTTAYAAKLKVDFKQTLGGSIVKNQCYQNLNITLPTTSTNVNCYSDEYGLFSLSEKPQLYISESAAAKYFSTNAAQLRAYFKQNRSETLYRSTNPDDYQLVNRLCFVKSIQNIIRINPSLSKFATFEWKADIVCENADQTRYSSTMGAIIEEVNVDNAIPTTQVKVIASTTADIYDGAWYFWIDPDYRTEPFVMNTSNGYIASLYNNIRFTLIYDYPEAYIVRITFKVIPTNGSNPYIITKYFKPILIPKQVYDANPLGV